MYARKCLIPCLLLVLIACSTVPITHRQQLQLVPNSTMLSMSFQQYDQFLQENKPVTNTPEAMMVKQVGKRISRAVETYFRQNGMSDKIKDYRWEFNLIEDKTVNAWCMPGGKVVVYSGILPIAKNATGLAVVMGHEIAHAIAGHGNERMSQQLAVQMGGVALGAALADSPQKTQQIWMAAFGLGSQVGLLLPYSRLHESEADHLGLIFMAMAGYNPQEAVDFWQRMAAEKKGGAPPEFLSTHPADQTRIRDIQKYMPEAMAYYRKS